MLTSTFGDRNAPEGRSPSRGCVYDSYAWCVPDIPMNRLQEVSFSSRAAKVGVRGTVVFVFLLSMVLPS